MMHVQCRENTPSFRPRSHRFLTGTTGRKSLNREHKRFISPSSLATLRPCKSCSQTLSRSIGPSTDSRSLTFSTRNQNPRLTTP
jgi:hypothetical protein